MCFLGPRAAGALTKAVRQSYRRAENADEPALRREADRVTKTAPEAAGGARLAAAVAVVDATIRASEEPLVGGEAQAGRRRAR